MATSVNSSPLDNNDHAPEYYEEVDHHTLDFLNRKRRPPKAASVKIVRKPPQVIDPLKQLNEQLNRQYRPDLVPPTPSPSSESPVSVPSTPQTPPPDPVIFDARAKPVKPVEEKKEPSVSVKHKLRSRIHQLTAPTPDPFTPSPEDFDQPITNNRYPPAVYQQQEQMTTVIRPSRYPPPYPAASEDQPRVVAYNNSFKSNKVAPPSLHTGSNIQKNDPNASHKYMQSLTPWYSTNPPTHSKGTSNQRTTQNSVHQSNTNNKKSKKSSTQDTLNNHRSIALYNQKNGRIEGVVKNRLNVVGDGVEDGQLVDDETTPKNKVALWLSQPLCLGLKRLNGGLLFGSMILLGVAAIAGLIAASATYSADSVNDAQWKILGIVVCTIMLITIIVTAIIFYCCYKYGYMFNDADDIDATDPSGTVDAEGNERQKAVLRKIYKFNRPLDASSIPSSRAQDVYTSASYSVVEVDDKQTNTQTTIAPVRPKDFDRGVWMSTNAFGGMAYRPLIRPVMTSRIVQVLPSDFEEIIQPTQVVYEVVAPAAREVQPRYVQLPPQQTSFIEIAETKPKRSRAAVVHRPHAEEIVVQPAATRIEYVDVKEPRSVRRKIQPQYEMVEEIVERSDVSSMEEIVEVVDAPKHRRQREKKTRRSQAFGGVSIKHVKATNDEPYVIVKDYHS